MDTTPFKVTDFVMYEKGEYCIMNIFIDKGCVYMSMFSMDISEFTTITPESEFIKIK